VGLRQHPALESEWPTAARRGESLLRLVPNVTCQQTLERIRVSITALFPDVEVHPEPGLDPCLATRAVLSPKTIRDAYRVGFGSEVAFTRAGGSTGAVPSWSACPARRWSSGSRCPSTVTTRRTSFFDGEQAAWGISRPRTLLSESDTPAVLGARARSRHGTFLMTTASPSVTPAGLGRKWARGAFEWLVFAR
jgi:hypothetical protein